MPEIFLPSQRPFAKTWSPVVWWLLFCMVVWGAPLLLLLYGYENIVAHRRMVLEDRVIQRFDRVFSSLQQASEVENFFRRILIKASHVLTNPRVPLPVKKALLRRMDARFPGVFLVTVLDSSGNLVPGLSNRSAPKRVLKDFFQAVMRAAPTQGTKDVLMLPSSTSTFKNFFGPFSAMTELGVVVDQLNRSSYSPERTFYFISRPRPQRGMLVAHINRVDGWNNLPLRYRVNLQNQYRKAIKVILLTHGEPVMQPSSLSALEIASFPVFLQEVSGRQNEILVHGKTLACYRELEKGRGVILVGRDTRQLHAASERPWLILAAGFVLIGLSWGTWQVMTDEWELSLSIRWKMIFLFLYLVVLPLAFMGMNARNYLVERHNFLENQIYQRTEKVLQEFDTRFSHYMRSLGLDLEHILSAPVPPSSDPNLLVRTTKSRILAIREKYDIGKNPMYGSFYMVSRDGMVLFSSPRTPATDAISFDQLLTGMGYSLLLAIAEHSEQSSSSTDQARSAITGMMTGEFKSFFNSVANQLRSLGEFKFWGPPRLLCLQPIFDRHLQASLMVIFGWGRNISENHYVRTELASEARRLESTVLLVQNRQTGETWLSKPLPIWSRQEFQALLTRLSHSRQTLRNRLDFRDASFLVTGISGVELGDAILVGVTEDKPIRQEIRRLSRDFAGVGFLMILVSIVMGMILSRKFLDPVRHLSSGVAALKNRDFSHRVDVLEADELGALSATFNEVMEGMEDLEVARVVQESLFPQAPVHFGSVRVFGSCTAAAQVGGDYFDYFPVSEGRMAILIGDVSGHGVSAALVMGMAKALIAHPSSRLEPAPAIEILNQVFHGILKHSKIMTFIFAILDPERQTLTVCNAGHPFPYLLRDGNLLCLEKTNFPLGLQVKLKFSANTWPIQKGDSLVMITDGLPEAPGKTSESISYDTLEAALPGLLRPDPVETVAAVMKWHEEVRREGPLTDDITVVVATFS